MKTPGTLTLEVARSHQPPARTGPRVVADAVTTGNVDNVDNVDWHGAYGPDLARARPPSSCDESDDQEGHQEGHQDGRDDVDLAEVYRRHGEQVSRWAARLAGPTFDIEDIVHDVFLVVQRRLGEFRGDARISTWLYEITVRVVQARRRWMRRRRWIWPFGTGTIHVGAEVIEIADGRISALDALERRQATALLYRFLDELDDKYRTAVVLFELEGVSCREIATITGVSIENVWARVSRGREKLIQIFARWEAKRGT
jgi:RNA polymerase sigma-70 factor (ECF subfamily)